MTDGLFLGRSTNKNGDFRLSPERLRTHGVVVGMTGSGKTGLCLVLLEELVRARVPIIAIDPKGDLGNLGLLFPGLSKEEFAPWISNNDDAEAVADQWRNGLSNWGLSEADVKSLSDQLDLTVYSPGSEVAVPVDLLGCLERPQDQILEDPESKRDLIKDTVGGLLGLVGRPIDPVKDPAHIVLSSVIDHAWTEGGHFDLETLILKLLDPPFEKVGVFPVDQFFPRDARMELAMALNGIVASPAFAAWTKGSTLDVERMLSPGMRTSVHVFALGHLSDNERHFFLSLLLGRIQAWTRIQPGSDDLRAVLFFDEVAGYLPPHPQNPPTKQPLLLMMKQARAVGFGVVLATQNPVDLDYKALSNAGLWCIGRLNTAQDRARLLKGLDAESDLDAEVAGLNKRHFLIHQVGRGSPEVVGSRHALCFLRGPLTKTEWPRINQLRGVPPITASTPAPGPSSETAIKGTSVPPSLKNVEHWFLDSRTAFSARFSGAFEDAQEPRELKGKILYRPGVLAELQLRFDEDRVGFFLDRTESRVWFPLGGDLGEPKSVALEPEDLLSQPGDDAMFEALPGWLDEAKELKQAQKQIVDQVYRSETEGMFVHKKLKLYGKPEESRENFAARCRDSVEDRIESAVAKLQERYQSKAERLEDKLEKAKMKLVELEGVAKSRQLEEAVNIGSTILSFFGGRKKSLGSAVRKRRQSSTASSRVDRTRETIHKLEDDAVALVEELEEKVEEIRDREEALLEQIENRVVRLEKNDIRLARFGILWVPVQRRLERRY